MSIQAPTNSQNNRGGNGRYMPLRRRRKSPRERAEDLQATLNMIDRRDLKKRFKNTTDPVFIAFDFVDSQSIPQLALEFVKDSIFDFTNFISKVTK